MYFFQFAQKTYIGTDTTKGSILLTNWGQKPLDNIKQDKYLA